MAGQGSEFTDSSTWSPIVRSMYPEILCRTYSVPPIFFHRVPYRRQIVPGTDYVPGIGPVPGRGLPALVLEQPLAAGDMAPVHDLTPDCLPPSQQPVSSASQQPMPSASQQPISSASQQPISSASQQPMSSASQQPMSSASQQLISSASQQPISSASQQSMSSASQQPMSSASQQPMSSANQQPMSSASQQPMPSASQQPMSSASQQPMSSANQQPLSSASQQPISSASQQSMSSASQQPMPSTSHGFLNMDPLRDLWSRHTQQKRKGKKQKGGKQKKPKPILPTVQQTDVNDDEAQAQVLRNLQELAEHRHEVMFIISQLNFTDYLNKPEYATAVASLPPVPMNPITGKKFDGDFDIAIINRQRGILIGELKVVGKDSSSRSDAIVSTTVGKALKQLDKSNIVMRHLVSDVAPGLSVQTTVVLPFVRRMQLQRVFTADPLLAQDACNTLGAADAAEATKLCLCSDQLSKPSTWWDVTPDVINELDIWWQGRMNQIDPKMTDEIYVSLVSRCVGPATAVLVNCTTRPRLEVKTADQAIHELGQQLSMLVLTPQQIDIVQQRDKNPLVYLTGPPGTGKTVVLTLVGLCRLRQGKDVHVVNGHIFSRAGSSLIKIQLETTLTLYSTSPSGCGQVYLHHYDLKEEAEKDRAVRELTAIGPDVFLIFDELTEPGYGGQPPRYFPNLLTQLKARVNLRLWSAGILHSKAPPELLQIPLTTPLRSAPSILREVQEQIKGPWSRDVHPYNNTMLSAAGDGMRVERLVHEDGDINGHTGHRAELCFLCGQNLAALLLRLGVGSTIQCSDVLVLSWDFHDLRKDVADDANTTTNVCSLAEGLQHGGLAVQVMADPGIDRASWEREVGEVAEATSNSIVMTDFDSVHGMERKVVVVLAGHEDLMLFGASRATTQLVVVEENNKEHSSPSSDSSLPDADQSDTD